MTTPALVDFMDSPSRLPRVLVVNDDATQLRVLSGLLQKAGLEPITHKSVESALASIDQGSPPVLIITDVYMPGIDGWRFCRLLRSREYQRFNQIPILVISATFSGEEPSRITSDLGANAFLSVPVDGQQFLELVQSLLQGKKLQSLPKVLIVEDSKLIARRIRMALEERGYFVEVAFTYQEGLSMIAQSSFDLAILDYHLPDGLGDRLLEVISAKSPDCVCMMMTGDPQPDLALSWMKMGAAAYVHKPFETEYLILLCERSRRERALLRSQDLLDVRTHQLQDSEARFRNAMEATNDGLWDWDVASGQVYYSPAYLGMLGYTAAEFPGSLDVWLAYIHPDDREAAFAANLACQRNEAEKIDIEFRMLTKDGTWRWIRRRGRALYRDPDGQALEIIGTHQDISEQKQAQAELQDAQRELENAHRDLKESFERERQLARIDELTGVNNRRSLFEFAEYELEVSRRYCTPLSVLMYDIDDFKHINDAYGHAIGDQVLRYVTQIVCANLRATDIIGRYGGDEFVVLLPHTSAQEALPLSERIHTNLVTQLMETKKGFLSITISLGIAQTITDPGPDFLLDEKVEDLFTRADLAMYTAKKSGRNRSAIIDPGQNGVS